MSAKKTTKKTTKSLSCEKILEEFNELKRRNTGLKAQVQELQDLCRKKEYHIQQGKLKLGEERKRVEELESELAKSVFQKFLDFWGRNKF